MKLNKAEDICLRIMVDFEGLGFDQLIGNFDGAIWTYSIGFTIKYGDLQKLIKLLYQTDKKLFHKCCTVYVPFYKKEMDLSGSLLSMANMSIAEASAWALARQKNNKPDKQWIDVFKNLGSQQKFQTIQRTLAYEKFNTATKYCNKYDLNTCRGLMLFFDCTVQQGSMSASTQERIDNRAKNIKEPKKSLWYQKHLMKICAEEMAEQALDRWAADVYSRRMTIVNGEGLVHGKWWNLDKDYGLSDSELD
jgi:hypothetical protein